MKISGLQRLTDWDLVYKLALLTEGKDSHDKQPSDDWCKRIIESEHSPIRSLLFVWTFVDIPYWVSVHLSRHKIGIEHYVRTQRSDRTGVERDDLPQGAPVKHTCIANAQALINISRKRLCHKASAETRQAWELLRDAIKEIDPIMASVMVKDCTYRGRCCEMKPCGFFEKKLDVSE